MRLDTADGFFSQFDTNNKRSNNMKIMIIKYDRLESIQILFFGEQDEKDIYNNIYTINETKINE